VGQASGDLRSAVCPSSAMWNNSCAQDRSCEHTCREGSYGRQRTHMHGCTVKLCGTLKAQKALLKSVHCDTECTMSILIAQGVFTARYELNLNYS